MSRRSWIQRLTAASAACALACALLAAPPAVAERSNEAASQEIGAAGSGLLGVVSTSAKRNPFGATLKVRFAAPSGSACASTPYAGHLPAGNVAPALIRWRLAHGTSTASP
jgi:hypothetical protein